MATRQYMEKLREYPRRKKIQAKLNFPFCFHNMLAVKKDKLWETLFIIITKFMKQLFSKTSNPAAGEPTADNDWSELVIKSVITGFSICFIIAIDIMIYGAFTH